MLWSKPCHDARELETELRELVPRWSLGTLVNALQALRGVALVIAVTLVAEVGDIAPVCQSEAIDGFPRSHTR